MLNTSRYGRKVRKNYLDVTKKQKELYNCPVCGKKKVKRASFAVWVCKSCGAKIAGGAYTLTTSGGEAGA
jgi:large subunit ribosomal protein L37Ae